MSTAVSSIIRLLVCLVGSCACVCLHVWLSVIDPPHSADYTPSIHPVHALWWQKLWCQVVVLMFQALHVCSVHLCQVQVGVGVEAACVARWAGVVVVRCITGACIVCVCLLHHYQSAEGLLALTCTHGAYWGCCKCALCAEQAMFTLAGGQKESTGLHVRRAAGCFIGSSSSLLCSVCNHPCRRGWELGLCK